MTSFNRGHWQQDEHQRFLEALRQFPQGPWADIAKYVGTRSARQVQTHANKYYEKIERHVRGLQRDRSRCGAYKHLSYGDSAKEHEIDPEILDACSKALESGVRLPMASKQRDDCEDEDDDGGELLPLDQSLDFLIEWLSATM